MDNKKNVKVSNFYGRARRIAFAEKVVYWLVGIVAVALLIFLILNRKEEVDLNVNFAFLRETLTTRGYICDQINRIGGSCVKTGTVVNEKNEDLNFKYTYTFIRYDDGFEYIYDSRGYILDIRHKENDSRITFRTTDNAFAGYRNQIYTCTYKDNVLNELEECTSEDGATLDNESYKGIIRQSMMEVHSILDNSGYKKDKLLNNYVWEKDNE